MPFDVYYGVERPPYELAKYTIFEWCVYMNAAKKNKSLYPFGWEEGKFSQKMRENAEESVAWIVITIFKPFSSSSCYLRTQKKIPSLWKFPFFPALSTMFSLNVLMWHRECSMQQWEQHLQTFPFSSQSH